MAAQGLIPAFRRIGTSSRPAWATQKHLLFFVFLQKKENQPVCLSLSVISEPSSQLSSKPLTCGGGSGIVQNTKALILKSEYVRMENEISKLKQQNEQLIKQKNQLSR